MKKTAALFLCLILFALVSCGEAKKPETAGTNGKTSAPALSSSETDETGKVETFSWQGICAQYEGIEGQGILRDGFVNTDISPVKTSAEALARAEREHPKGEDEEVLILFDETENVWCVSFYPKDPNVLGGCMDVYLSGEGKTLLMVAGE